jgi:16S rRNA (cytosine1402-N4)-methyltransferase
VEQIKLRGATPVGTHRPICVQEILEILKPRPGETALDATLGYGGHTSSLIEKLLPGGTLIALDQDPIERPKTVERLRSKGWGENVLKIGEINFSEAKNFLAGLGIPRVDMVLADLGLSSMQIDNPDRGFSLKVDAPLDLRMNPLAGMPAADFITTLSEEKLITILEENADELRSRQIAKAILKKMPRTTFELIKAVEEGMSSFTTRVKKEEGDSPIRRAFQALRIEINQEFKVLDKFLLDLPLILKPGGRVAILSFHSGEDKRVKKSFQTLFREGSFREISDSIVRPSAEEQRSNPRSKSAKLRWAIKK